MAKKKEVSNVKSEKVPTYSVEIAVNGEVLKGASNSLSEAISGIFNDKAFPFAIKSKVVINYSKDGVESGTRVIPIVTARRLVSLSSLKPEVVDLLVGKMLN